ncbi:hypothetical protein PIROE2DRAFT_11852 [Piromyces sp. E2]|nr:hypothetical protein PIROE2DRAFT_11852 [Piromyces sp. E2]|eukprot:OUM61975.1 hypothetical protein PIROE2DRAFT_11852 [Piromyces sp. E2]
MLLKTLQSNKTLNSYNYFYLTKTPLEINDDIKPDKRESKTFIKPNTEKYLIVPTDLKYTELLEELIRTSLRPTLMILIIIILLIIKSIHKQYITFKKRRRRMDIKKRLKVIETQTVPI